MFTVTSGSSTIVASGPCAAGTRVSYELKAEGNTELYYFQGMLSMNVVRLVDGD